MAPVPPETVGAIVMAAVDWSSRIRLFAPVPFTINANFIADPSFLSLPRFVNFSAGIERRLPWSIFGRLDYLKKDGTGIWAWEEQPSGSYILENKREDRYDAIQVTVRKELKRGYPFSFSYTRSHARTNEALEVNDRRVGHVREIVSASDQHVLAEIAVAVGPVR